MVRFAHIQGIGKYYSPSGTLTKSTFEKFCAVADVAFRELRDYCRVFAYGDIQELKKITGYSCTGQLEILLFLRPGERLDRKALTRIAHRRQITRALNRLAVQGLIIWDKRKQVMLTQKGTDLRKVLIQLHDPFISIMKETQGAENAANLSGSSRSEKSAGY